jgi:hypothetical protein
MRVRAVAYLAEGQTIPHRQSDRTTRNTQHKADVAKLQNGAALFSNLIG